ncbi:thrombospondin type 3 repeat-containing protein [Chondromyces apiculatus]|uniref:VWFA domain-containing protein n=1 Tax=Chondromyces apiculatus DSM 436 TaxID=1192034 RepID=A0A017SX24_9BACT|nr:thrombospondin type 3 repeat-containing protein [Chondromyces apiculatus]EYF01327.1 Hypothetical protein CAP_8369 [Chondromyces apiculatus DSM 436]
MRLRASAATGLLLLLTAAALPSACAPNAAVPPGGDGGPGDGGSGGVIIQPPAPCENATDADSDFVSDFLDLAPDTDTDDDGTPDHADTDSDDDGVPDADEAANPLLDPIVAGHARTTMCDPLADTDGDGTPDLRDRDSDNDGVPDDQDHGECRVLPDCDGDGVIDIIEIAAGTDPTSPGSIPSDAGLYFVLPFGAGEQTKEFSFKTGIESADIYFLIDTTSSMGPAIADLRASLSDEILPAILNGDPSAVPPIPPISDAWIGVGAFGDVPWTPYGQSGDNVYRHRFDTPSGTVTGHVSAPLQNGNGYLPPANVTSILDVLAAAGGGDSYEAATQALWIAATNQPYNLTGGGTWISGSPYGCTDLSMRGAPCFRPGSLPIFVLVTDAGFHNGPSNQQAYNPGLVGGAKTYAAAIAAIKDLGAKIVGVPVNTGTPALARNDLVDLATQTESLWHETLSGGADRPLVASTDVSPANVSTEVARLLGKLVGAGLNDVTTARSNYDCPGSTDCNGDGTPDPEYHNIELEPGQGPYNASQLITAIEPVPAPAPPLPYNSLDDTTFHGVRGNAEITFRVHAENTTLQPTNVTVLRALVRVVTPSGQRLGGPQGIKPVYFVVPPYIPVIE